MGALVYPRISSTDLNGLICKILISFPSPGAYSDFQLTVRRFRLISRGESVPALFRTILRRAAAAKTIETTTQLGARNAMNAYA
jgi:hypothetical protein